jgi:PKD domain
VLADGFATFINETLNGASLFLWEFGDGASSILANPTHRYAKTGAYTVTLRATNSAGQSTYSAVVTVTIIVPKADFTYSVGGFMIWLKDTSTVSGTPTWIFSDGTVMTGSEVKYNFGGNGTYSVTLKKGEYSKSITVTVYADILLSWDDNSYDEDGFYVEHSLDGLTGWTQIASVGANVTSYGVTYATDGVDSNVINYFRVRAYNGAGDSGYTNTVEVDP